MVRKLLRALAFALVVARIGTAEAQAFQSAKLTAPDASSGSKFGSSIDLSGDTAVIGASGDDTGGIDRGAAYVFVRGGDGSWSQQAKLTAPDGASGNRFGMAVAVDQDTAIIGAGYHDSGWGAVYVFVRSGTLWSLQQKLQASERGCLGGTESNPHAVDIDGDTVIAGASLSGMDTGAAFVFTRSGGVWTEQQKLVGEPIVSGFQFGSAVAISGDDLLISSLDSNQSGAVHMFTRSAGIWTEQQKLSANASAEAYFGTGLAIDGDTVAIGAGNDSAHMVSGGAAYMFERGGGIWSEQQMLEPADLTAYDQFGQSVALDGDTLLVGSHGISTGGNGAAYVFVRSGGSWSEDQRLVASDGASSDGFGVPVALENGTGLIASVNNDVGRGAVYQFTDVGVPPAPIAAASPSQITASPTIVNQTSTAYSLTLRNTGNAPLVVSNIATSGSDASQFAVAHGTCASLTPSLLPGASCALSIAFAPTSLTPSTSKSATLRILSNAADLDVPLSGLTGTAATIPTLSEWGMIILAAMLALMMLAKQAGWRAMRQWLGTLGLALVVGGVSTAQAQTTEQAVLSVSDATASFGVIVDISGDTAVIGAREDLSGGGTHYGVAYVFVRSGGAWNEQAKLVRPDRAGEGDSFGTSIAIDQDTIVVGDGHEWGPGGAQGAVYVFVRSGVTWSFQQKLQASDGIANGFFGGFGDYERAVDIEGDRVVIGAINYNQAAGAPGAAYVFERSGTQWTEQHKLVSDELQYDGFGKTVVLSGDDLVVTAPYDDHAGVSAGAVHVFRYNGAAWTRQAKLTAADAHGDAVFGSSVAIDGDTMAIGAAGQNGVAGGAAYVFMRNSGTWSQQQKLSPANPFGNDDFGHDLALEGDTLLGGSPDGDEGAAYVFVRSGGTWSEARQLTLSFGWWYRFGSSVALGSGVALVGATEADTGGAVYEFGGNSLMPPAPIPAVSPSQVTPSPTIVNDTSRAYTLTLRNTGDAPWGVSSIATSGADASQFAVARGTCTSLTPSLGPGASCTVLVTFAPTSVTPSTSKSATLRILSNAADLDVPLSGLTGTAATIPTLSEWGMIMLAAMLALIALGKQARSRAS